MIYRLGLFIILLTILNAPQVCYSRGAAINEFASTTGARHRFLTERTIRMWMLLTIYLLLSAFAACFVLSACLVSARISRCEEAKARTALYLATLPNGTHPTEVDQGIQPTGMNVTSGWREVAHVTFQ